MENEFNIIAKPIKYKVIKYLESDKRSLPLLMNALGNKLVVNKDSIVIRYRYGWIGICEIAINDGDYILIPEDEKLEIKVLSSYDNIKKDYFILK